MPAVRKNLKVSMLVLLTAFLLSSVEWHSDHDISAQAPCQECCLQCCPSHHLAPTVSISVTRLPPLSAEHKTPKIDACPLENHPQRIERPPIA